jgi:hypothetical protein
MEGFVTDRSEGGFSLCKSIKDEYPDDYIHHEHEEYDDGYDDDDEYHDDDYDESYDRCLAVSIKADTVVQDNLIELTSSNNINNGDKVTVLGKFYKLSAEALHIVIHENDKAVSDLAMFNGKATSDFDVDNFTMETDDGNAVIQPLTLLTIALVEGSGVRVFDKLGNIISADNIITGRDVDVFGLAQPDIATVSKVKAAFIIIDTDDKVEKISGTIAAVDEINAQVTVTVQSDTFSGDVCVATTDSIIFILAIVDGKVVSKQITLDQLRAGMLVDAYVNDEIDGCYPADALLVAEPLAVSPASAQLFTGD